MWAIDKTLEFCYGHRVWTQTLNGEYASDLKCACRHLHGHEGKVRVFLTSDILDQTGMVTDFRHLEWLKKWINEFVDHQFIIDRNDPLYPTLLGDPVLQPLYVPGTDHVAGHTIVDGEYINKPGFIQEMLEGILIVDFPPTSEHLSKWMFGIVDAKMKKIGVTVQRIEWWETPRSRSTYTGRTE